MEDKENWAMCSNCAWTWGPGSEDDANAAALEHQEQTGHQANVNAGSADAHAPDGKP